MKKFSLIAIIIYLFSGALIVHAFAMHENISQGEITHNNKISCFHMGEHEKSDGGMNHSLCLDQATNQIITSPPIFDKITTTTFFPEYEDIIVSKTLSTYFSHHDPGWDQYIGILSITDFHKILVKIE